MSTHPQKILSSSTILFAGDSGDGMQLAGDQFTDTTGVMGNDFATFPNFPAEIRAPLGTLPGVSSFQIQFSDTNIYTHGDMADVLVAINPAALKVNLNKVKPGGLIVLNENAFNETDYKRAAWASDPLTDGTLNDFQVLKVPVTDLTKNALKDIPLKISEIERCKNFFVLGMMFWLYARNFDHTIDWIQTKFAARPEIVNANIAALKAGHNYAETTETIVPAQTHIHKAKMDPGTYRKISGNNALAIGLITAAHLSEKTLFYASYPITPASEILHELSEHKEFKVKTFQAEDEIAAMAAAIGAAFGGELSATSTSGPGMCLKSEGLNLAVMTELPIVIVDVQRAGPSTGMPTKIEQADLLQAMYGRNGESPVAVLAPKTPSDCFDMALEAVRLSVKYMSPVILLSDAYLANSSEPWKLPDTDKLPKIKLTHPTAGKNPFLPYARDPKTLARAWAKPGTPGLEHRIGGLSKADLTGNVSYDPDNHEKMIRFRAEKIQLMSNDIPLLKVRGPESGKLLVLGWGSTYGVIHQAVSEITEEGHKISQAHLNYLNPFPKNLQDILKNFKTILIPELNTGHLNVLIKNRFPETKTEGYNRMRGVPFQTMELKQKIKEML